VKKTILPFQEPPKNPEEQKMGQSKESGQAVLQSAEKNSAENKLSKRNNRKN
jgi:hypothetical protein